MHIIKRSGAEEEFSPEKIRSSIEKANKNEEVPSSAKLSDLEMAVVVERVTNRVNESPHALNVEDIGAL